MSFESLSKKGLIMAARKSKIAFI